MRRMSISAITVSLVTVCASPHVVFADQTITPNGMGGWVVHESEQPITPNLNKSPECAGAVGSYLCTKKIMQQEQLQQESIKQQKLQNELLRRQLEREKQAQQQPSAPPTDPTQDPVYQTWLSENTWFGKNKEQTEFAVQYANQLRKDFPTIRGRSFLDAVTIKTKERFGKLEE